MSLWSCNDFLSAIGVVNYEGRFVKDITGISIDSRTLKKGDAFFAIRGPRFDGHDFAEDAMNGGASVLVLDQKASAEKLVEIQRKNTPFIFVNNVLSALESVAIAARIRTKAKVIAITGSVGKTTLKEMLRHVLRLNGKIHANPASFNNHLGVPLTLARMPFDTDFGIFEIGMNHANEIRHLVRLVAPDLVLINRIGAAHLGNFRNLQDIAAAKAEIFEAIQPIGCALLNIDDRFFYSLTEKAKKTGITHIASFGKAKAADYRLLKYNSCACHSNSTSTRFWMRIGKKKITGKLMASGLHMVQNALAILGIIDLLRKDVQQSVESLLTFVPINGRGMCYRLKLPNQGNFLLIDESYNANPVSMQVGLELLAASPVKGRKIAVLGDMLELGSFSRQMHENLFFLLKKRHIDLVLLCGREMRFLSDIITMQKSRICHSYRKEAEDLLPLILCTVRSGDSVMIKSSKSIGTLHLVVALVEMFEKA